jgi:hypothetical protein
MTAHPIDVGECLRDQNRPVDRAAHSRDATRFIDGRTDHGEIEPFGASDIAAENFAHMQTDIHVGDRSADEIVD